MTMKEMERLVRKLESELKAAQRDIRYLEGDIRRLDK